VGGEQFARIDEALGQHVVGLADPVDETQRVCFLGVDVTAAQHQVQCGFGANETRRALRAASTRQQAEGDLGQAESRGSGGDPVVGRECDFESATERGAADCRDDRLAASLDPVADLGQ